MNKTLNKSEKEKQSVLAMLDAEDAKIPANPGLNTQAAGGEFEKLFSASTTFPSTIKVTSDFNTAIVSLLS